MSYEEMQIDKCPYSNKMPLLGDGIEGWDDHAAAG